MTPRELALSLLEIISPDWPSQHEALGRAATRWLRETLGVIGAWIEAAALDDLGNHDELTMVVAMDEGFETSDALEVEGQTLVIAGVACDVLRDTLEIDPELVEILAKGYRLCGVDREIFELSALAGEITGRPSF